MFRKLLSNLPFNPSLIDQVAFYGQRLKKETSIRRLGFVLVVLALIVQFAAINLPTKKVAANPNYNDLIPGGVSSAARAANYCEKNTNYHNILNYYGIPCDSVAKAQVIRLVSTDTSYGGVLYSAGYQHFKNPSVDKAVQINSSVTLYWRPLHVWDAYNYSTYYALKFTNKLGLTFFILETCGNLVSVGFPSPPPVPKPPKPGKPNLTLYKTNIYGYPANKSTVPPGSILGFRLVYNNIGTATANNATVTDAIPVYSSFYKIGGGSSENIFHSVPGSPFPGQPVSQYAEWVNYTMPAHAQNWYNDLYLKINSSTPNGQEICNVAFIRSTETAVLESNKICVTVEKTASCTLSCLSFSKQAENLTRGISNANGTTAHAGDIIKYTLTVKNNGDAPVNQFTIQESLADVLVYSDIKDPGGGLLDSEQILSWSPININTGQTVQRSFTVQVKNPIPQNPPNQADPMQYDLVMTNFYGNVVNIKLPGGVIHTTAQTITTLPNTGPGSSLLIAGGLTVIVGYFFYRSRLLTKEIELVRHDFNSNGEF